MCNNMATNMGFDFSGKVAIVTGSSSGLGEAIACHLSSYGCRVTITGRSEDNLKRVADECRQLSPNNHEPNVVIGDLFHTETMDRIVQSTVNKFQQVDILVNNAGGHYPCSLDSPQEVLKSFDFIFGVNVRSILYLTSLTVPYLERSKGSIVNISSIGSFSAFNDEKTIIYSMSKAAVDMFSRCMALSHGPKGIRVNTINPGPFKTKIYRNYATEEQYEQELKHYEKASALGRYGQPKELADLVSYLVSDRAGYITGANFVIDGGCSIPKFS